MTFGNIALLAHDIDAKKDETKYIPEAIETQRKARTPKNRGRTNAQDGTYPNAYDDTNVKSLNHNQQLRGNSSSNMERNTQNTNSQRVLYSSSQTKPPTSMENTTSITRIITEQFVRHQSSRQSLRMRTLVGVSSKLSNVKMSNHTTWLRKNTKNRIRLPNYDLSAKMGL